MVHDGDAPSSGEHLEVLLWHAQTRVQTILPGSCFSFSLDCGGLALLIHG